jgi:hypothetical protein
MHRRHRENAEHSIVGANKPHNFADVASALDLNHNVDEIPLEDPYAIQPAYRW